MAALALLAVLTILTGGLGAIGAAAADEFAPELTGVALHDTTVMQSMAWDPTGQTWVFAQVTGSGRFGQSVGTHVAQGDMTLTQVSPWGRVLGFMYLRGFGHGISIGLQWSGGQLWVWTEAVSKPMPAVGHTDVAGGAGTQIARFAWRNGATLLPTSPGVERFHCNAGSYYQSPALDLADGLIGVRYYSAALHAMRWAVYPLGEFQAHHFVAVTRLTIPSDASGDFIQGWTVEGATSLISYNGRAYSDTNPQPGDAVVSSVGGDGSLREQQPMDAAADLDFREPEGMTSIAGIRCVGLASGAIGARRANVYCTSSPFPASRPLPPLPSGPRPR